MPPSAAAFPVWGFSSLGDIRQEDYTEFQSFLEGLCGIRLHDDQQYLVLNRMNDLLHRSRSRDLGEFIQKASATNGGEIRMSIIHAMTTNETSWFRFPSQFEVLRDRLFPEMIQDCKESISIWSAAASTGQEAYSIAIAYQELLHSSRTTSHPKLDILATDISSMVLQQAKEGLYSDFTISRGLSDDMRQRYFSQTSRGWTISPEIQQQVQFRELNLLNYFESNGPFDIVFCCNVLIYFSRVLKVDLLRRISKVLRPGGYLFLGGTETLNDLSDSFEVVRDNGVTFYRLQA